MKYETQEGHGMRSGGQVEIATLGSATWMLCGPQGVKGLDDDDDDDDDEKLVMNKNIFQTR